MAVISWKVKLTVCAWFTVQNSIHTLILRYSRARKVEQMFLASVSIFWMEIMKLFMCFCLIWAEKRSFSRMCHAVWETVILHPMDTLKVCLPAFLYVGYNNLIYLAATYMDAATLAVTSQIKIFTTALFAILLLSQQLNRYQWLSQMLLFMGVSAIQLTQTHESNPNVDSKSGAILGFGAMLASCFLSGFAGIYFEKVLKGAQISVWMRNVQLAVCAIPLSLITAFVKDGAFILENGVFYGFDAFIWFNAFWGAIGGLSVAGVIKYADNIVKNFAAALSILLSTVASVYFMDFEITSMFSLGATFVIASIFLYRYEGKKEKTVSMQEIMENGAVKMKIEG